jgi:glutaredoxin
MQAFQVPFEGANLASQLVIVLYSRNGCHLCDDAFEMLRQRQERFGFRLDVVDIDSNPELRNRYDQSVPVIEVNGKVRFHGRVNVTLLDRLLVADHQSQRK